MRPIATSAAWSVCLKVLADYRAHTSKHVVVLETRWHADYPRQDALGCRKEHQLAGSVSCPHIRPSLSSPSISSPSLSIPAMSTPANSSVNVQSCNFSVPVSTIGNLFELVVLGFSFLGTKPRNLRWRTSPKRLNFARVLRTKPL